MLIVTSEFPPQPGGIGNHAYNLALQLSRHYKSVTVIADQRSEDAVEESVFDASLPYQVIRIAITRPRVIMYFNRIQTVFKMLKKADQVIATGKFSLWSVAFCSLFRQGNYVAIIHGSEVNFKSHWLRKSINWSLKRFDGVIAVSNFTKQLVASLHLDVVVIPNGFNAEQWLQPTPLHSQLKGSPKLITVGNVSSRKGQLNVIRQLPALLKHFPDLHYHCVGLKTEADKFLAQARVLGVETYVSFHGRVEDDQLKAMLKESDLFVMLSTETSSGDVEGFGIAILEANALGIPAIGAINCGIADAIEDGVSGLLIDPLDGKAFLNAIKTILAQPQQYKLGAKNWSQQHQWNDIGDAYLRYLT